MEKIEINPTKQAKRSNRVHAKGVRAYLHMVQPSNNNNGSPDMDSLEDMLRKVNIVLVLVLPRPFNFHAIRFPVYRQHSWLNIDFEYSRYFATIFQIQTKSSVQHRIEFVNLFLTALTFNIRFNEQQFSDF